MANLSDANFVFQNRTNPQNRCFAVQETWTELCGTVDNWITVSLQTFLLEVYRVKILKKRTKNKKYFWQFIG